MGFHRFCEENFNVNKHNCNREIKHTNSIFEKDFKNKVDEDSSKKKILFSSNAIKKFWRHLYYKNCPRCLSPYPDFNQFDKMIDLIGISQY